jgi:addiction module HigA family antidote
MAYLSSMGERARSWRRNRGLSLGGIVKKKKMPSVHPGEILMEEFLKPLGITQYRVAKDIHVPPRRINEIVHGARAISADTALRLGRYFRLSPQFWLNLQAHYDLEVVEERLAVRLAREVHIFPFPAPAFG